MIISRSCLIAADVILILITWISLWKRVVHVSGRPTRLPFTKVLLWDGACIVRVCPLVRQPQPKLSGASDSESHTLTVVTFLRDHVLLVRMRCRSVTSTLFLVLTCPSCASLQCDPDVERPAHGFLPPLCLGERAPVLLERYAALLMHVRPISISTRPRHATSAKSPSSPSRASRPLFSHVHVHAYSVTIMFRMLVGRFHRGPIVHSDSRPTESTPSSSRTSSSTCRRRTGSRR